jgi:hypothetical protein
MLLCKYDAELIDIMCRFHATFKNAARPVHGDSGKHSIDLQQGSNEMLILSTSCHHVDHLLE